MAKSTGIYGNPVSNKDKYLQKYKRLYEQELDDSAIARNLGVSYTTTRAWRIKLGLAKQFKYQRHFDEKLFEELYNKGLNYSQIARELHISDSAAQDYGSSHGYKSRPKHHLDSELSQEEFQILLGTVLGDAYLGKSKVYESAFFSFTHSLKQQQYCLWKYEKLKRFVTGSPKVSSVFDKRTGNTYYNIMVKSHCSPVIGALYSKFYNNRVKYINRELLTKIEPLGLAVWFMDDGMKTQCGYELSTNAFTAQDLDVIIEVLSERFDLHFTKCASNVLYLTAKDKDKFTNLIQPFIHPDCSYKLHGVR